MKKKLEKALESHGALKNRHLTSVGDYIRVGPVFLRKEVCDYSFIRKFTNLVSTQVEEIYNLPLSNCQYNTQVEYQAKDHCAIYIYLSRRIQ